MRKTTTVASRTITVVGGVRLRRRAYGLGSGDGADGGWAAEAGAAGQRRRRCGLGIGDGCEVEGF